MLILVEKIIFSDEAHFDLGGYVNKQYCRIWGTENLHAYIDKPTHPKRVTVWYGFWSRRIIKPFVFKNEHRKAVTGLWLYGDHYQAMLNEFLFRKIEENDISNICCHRYRAMLNEFLFTKIEEDDIGNI